MMTGDIPSASAVKLEDEGEGDCGGGGSGDPHDRRNSNNSNISSRTGRYTGELVSPISSSSLPDDATAVGGSNSLLSAVTLPNAILCEGWLRKQAHNFSRDWHRRYFVLTSCHLLYYYQPLSSGGTGVMSDGLAGSGSGGGTSPSGTIPSLGGAVPRCQIPLISANVKAVLAGDKLHMRRFRILTPARDYLLEAETVEEAVEWVSAIQEAIEGRILTDCAASTNNDIIISGQQQMHASSTIDLVPGSRQLREELTSIPGNEVCADCGLPNPSWVSTNLGVLLCIECSGVHRSLGCQVSRVRSLELDTFYPETIEVIRLLGNARMNAIWEGEIEECSPRKAALLSLPSPGEERRAYIQDKYIGRIWTGHPVGAADTPLVSPRTLATLFSPELELFEAMTEADVARTACLLYRYGLDVNIRHGVTGWTPLHAAAGAGQALQVHFLVLNGASALAKDEQGRIPSEIALRSGHMELADHLMKYQKIMERGARALVKGEGTASEEGRVASSQASMTLRICEGLSNLQLQQRQQPE